MKTKQNLLKRYRQAVRAGRYDEADRLAARMQSETRTLNNVPSHAQRS